MALDTKQPKGYRKAWNGGQRPRLDPAMCPHLVWHYVPAPARGPQQRLCSHCGANITAASGSTPQEEPR